MKSSVRACASLFSAVALLDCQLHSAPPPVEPPAVNRTAATPAQAVPSDAPTPAQLRLDDEVLVTFFDEDIPRASGGYTYSYGGSTSNQILPTTTLGNAKVFAASFDNDYSGVNISQGNSTFIDLTRTFASRSIETITRCPPPSAEGRFQAR